MRDRRGSKFERAVRRDDLRDAVEAARPAVRERQIVLARIFYEADRCAHFVFEAAASIGEWGHMHGYSPFEARAYRDVGLVLSEDPRAEERLLSGAISFDHAATLAKLFAEDGAIRPGEDWLLLAQGLNLRDLRDAVRARVKETKAGEPTTRLNIEITTRGRRAFDKAREMICRREKRVLDEGETVEFLSIFYIDTTGEDPEDEDGPPDPAVPPTPDDDEGPVPEEPPETESGGDEPLDPARVAQEKSTRSRYIPVAERRKLRKWARKHGRTRCQFPTCDRWRFLQYCHRKPFWKYGRVPASEMLLLCPLHHAMLDKSWIRADGPSRSPRFFRREVEEGRERWVPVRGPP